MRPGFLAFSLLTIMAISSCQKDDSTGEVVQTVRPYFPEMNNSNNLVRGLQGKILVDASKDGGTWWYPQSPGNNNPALPHQGQKLANYLRTLGYQVDELTQGTRVTWSMLKAYHKVIRAAAVYAYTPGELSAYDSLLKDSSSLLLMQDHLSNFPNDMLSEHLNIRFAGAGGTTIGRFNPHPITQGVGTVPFIAGSAIINYNKATMTILGYLPDSEYIDLNHNNLRDAGDIIGAPVMGILHHPSSRIFFIGDVNGLETVSQPFTANLVKWLFN